MLISSTKIRNKTVEIPFSRPFISPEYCSLLFAAYFTDYIKVFKKCKGLPAGISTVLRQINSFQYDTKPDYHLIKNIFRNAILNGNYKVLPTSRSAYSR